MSDYMVLLYDLERYAGERHAPGYKPGDTRFGVTAFGRPANSSFWRQIWSMGATTYEEARAMVPCGGVYFDRSTNYPSPMVPIEGWFFAVEPALQKAREATL